MKITENQAAQVLEIVDAGLISGLGEPVPGKMCIEAAVCHALGLPHSDAPPCVAPSLREVKIQLNDADWSSPQARARGLRKLAVLQLGTSDEFDEIEFVRRIAMFSCTKQLPRALRVIGLEDEAKTCEAATSVDKAEEAARAAAEAARVAWAAAEAARTPAEAEWAAAAAAWAAAWAAEWAAAAWAAEWAPATPWGAVWAPATPKALRDAELIFFADGIAEILIDMNVPGVAFLPLLA